MCQGSLTAMGVWVTFAAASAGAGLNSGLGDPRPPFGFTGFSLPGNLYLLKDSAPAFVDIVSLPLGGTNLLHPASLPWKTTEESWTSQRSHVQHYHDGPGRGGRRLEDHNPHSRDFAPGCWWRAERGVVGLRPDPQPELPGHPLD